MKTFTFRTARLLCLLIVVAVTPRQARALELPIRISVNYILNASGNRPVSGDINTDDDVNAQVERANEILKENGTEYKFHLLGINEVAGQSAYYSLNVSEASRDVIRYAAQANPTAWHWRNDAINMYINAGTSSAISDFPPDNNIILFNQNIFDTTMMHEVGHSLSLYHTHESGGDGCSDTLPDDDSWTRDQIALNAYGHVYAECTASQRILVNNTWENLMSYHDGDNRHIITPQQNDRMSVLTYADRTWLLTDTPVYIKVGSPIYPWPIDMGSWTFPYPTIQSAIDAGEADDRTLILISSSSHADPTSVIDTDTDIITRRGTSLIHEMPPAYELRHDLENSTNRAVREAVVEAQNLAREGDEEGSLAALRTAAKLAEGRERQALLIEIGDRLKAREEFDEASTFYSRAADESDQPGLKKRFQQKAEKMKKLKAKKLERSKSQQVKDDNVEEEQP